MPEPRRGGAGGGSRGGPDNGFRRGPGADAPRRGSGGDAPEGAGPAGESKRHCASCRQLYPNSALDQRLWCPECREELQRKARIASHLGGVVITLPFGVWILVGASSEVLSPWAWVLPLVPAYYLGFRIGRELLKGWVRLKRRRS